MTQSETTRKIPLYEAQRAILDIMEKLEDGGDPVALLEPFKEAEKDLAKAADRYYFALDTLEMQAENARKKQKEWKRKAEIAENTAERIKEYAKQIVLRDEFLRYRGEYGNLRLQNSPKSLKIDLPLIEVQLRNVIITNEAMIPEKYIETISHRSLKTSLLREDLETTKYPWAALVQNRHLRWK